MGKHQHSARRRIINKTKKFLSTYSGGDRQGCNTSKNQDDRNKCNARVKGLIENKKCNYNNSNNFNLICNDKRIDINELVNFNNNNVYYKITIDNINVLILNSNNEYDEISNLHKLSPHFLYLYKNVLYNDYNNNVLEQNDVYILENVDGIIQNVEEYYLNMSIYIQIILAIYQFNNYTNNILNFSEENIKQLFYINNNETNILIYEFNNTKYVLNNVKYIVILNDFSNLQDLNDSNANNDYEFLKNIIPQLYNKKNFQDKLNYLVENQLLSNQTDDYQHYKPYKLMPEKKKSVRFTADTVENKPKPKPIQKLVQPPSQPPAPAQQAAPTTQAQPQAQQPAPTTQAQQPAQSKRQPQAQQPAPTTQAQQPAQPQALATRTLNSAPIDKCNNKFIGLAYKDNSCYIDTLFVALFHEKNNDIYEMFTTNIQNNKLNIQNKEIKNEQLVELANTIKTQLKVIIDKIQNGTEIFYCTDIRNSLEKFRTTYLNIYGNNNAIFKDIKFTNSQAEPMQLLQFLDILFKISKNIKIITTLTNYYYFDNKLYNDYYGDKTITMNNTKQIIDKFFNSYEQNELGIIDDTTNSINSNFAPIIIQYLNITKNLNYNNDYIDINIYKRENSVMKPYKNTTRVFNIKISKEVISEINSPFFFISINRIYYGIPTKNTDLIKPNEILNISNQTFYLRSIIVHNGENYTSGHYICLIKCDNLWYKYNDTNNGQSLELQGTYDKLHEYYFKNCTNFIYFKETSSTTKQPQPQAQPPQPSTQSPQSRAQPQPQAQATPTVPAAQQQPSQTNFQKYTIDDDKLKKAIMAAVGANLNHSYAKYNSRKGGKKSKSKLKHKSKKMKGGFDDKFKDPNYRLWAAQKLYECYAENNDQYILNNQNKQISGFAFPKWVINKPHYINDIIPNKFESFAFNDTIVLYNLKDDLEEVVKTVYFRDPVNITMIASYDPDLLNDYFNYTQSYYLTDYYNSIKDGDNKTVIHELINKHNTEYKLKPNIAIYCKALVNCIIDEYGNGQKSNTTLKNVKVNVMNLIGFGFDTSTNFYDKQPDYLYLNYLKEKMKFTDNQLLDKVVELYREMWLKLVYFIVNNNKIINSQNNNIQNVIISNVGGNNFCKYLNEILPTIFSKNLDQNDFIQKIYTRSFENSENINYLKSPKTILISNGINVVDGVRITNKYFIPGIINTIMNNNIPELNNLTLSGATLDNTLFVNAWDPHSIIGNGNYNDPSLDGYWGRYTNMSVLGWGFTNPEMTYVPVDFSNM